MHVLTKSVSQWLPASRFAFWHYRFLKKSPAERQAKDPPSHLALSLRYPTHQYHILKILHFEATFISEFGVGKRFGCVRETTFVMLRRGHESGYFAMGVSAFLWSCARRGTLVDSMSVRRTSGNEQFWKYRRITNGPEGVTVGSRKHHGAHAATLLRKWVWWWSVISARLMHELLSKWYPSRLAT